MSLMVLMVTFSARAVEAIKEGQAAPIFTAKNHAGADFDLSSRKGKWTVLYFYPKAGTPGCTKQACAFRDSINQIRKLDAEVYGISSDSVESQAKFHQEHKLTFDLIADPEGKIIEMYGTKMPVMSMSKRWTFIIDPQLKIRGIEKDVDPVMDATRVAKKIATLQAQK